MFCTNCGAKVEEGANFCTVCGAKVQTVTAEPYVPPSVPQTGPVPTAVAPAVAYAGFWRRFAAVFIDGIILWGVNSTLSLILPLPAADFSGQTNPSELGITYIISTLVSWLYYSLMECSSNQATVGKMAMGIIVTDMEGKRVSFGKATLRYYNKIISALILGIGFLMAAFTAKKQALHDIIAGTLVVMKR